MNAFLVISKFYLQAGREFGLESVGKRKKPWIVE